MRHVSLIRSLFLTVVAVITTALPVLAQTALTGKVTRAGGEAMAGAAVVVEELRREARTGGGLP